MTVAAPRAGSVPRLQDIPSEAARFCLDLEAFCRDELGVSLERQSLLVAYSGGADSKALLCALRFLTDRLKLTLHAAILDHGFRDESALEAAEAAQFCAWLGVPLHTGKQDVTAWAAARKIGLEEAGRLARLDFLERVRATAACSWIAFGHQLNDLAEDFVMRSLRGAGWPALGGMVGVARESRVLRPLLLTPRRALEAFLTALGETWVDDRMNQDPAYLRNRVRSDFIPLFERENPSFLESVAERWRMARQDAVLFADLTAAMREEPDEKGVFLPRSVLAASSPAMRLRKYMDILSRMGQGQVLAVRLRALDAAWIRGEGGKVVQFPGGKRAAVQRGGVVFFME